MNLEFWEVIKDAEIGHVIRGKNSGERIAALGFGDEAEETARYIVELNNKFVNDQLNGDDDDDPEVSRDLYNN